MSDSSIDDDLVASITLPASDPNAPGELALGSLHLLSDCTCPKHSSSSALPALLGSVPALPRLPHSPLASCPALGHVVRCLSHNSA